MLKSYKAFVEDEKGKKIFVTSDYDSKRNFVSDLRNNGYKVKVTNVKLEKVFNYLLNLASNDFYGKIVVTFEQGKVVHLKKEESLKPGVNF